jgi:hypothetical protein
MKVSTTQEWAHLTEMNLAELADVPTKNAQDISVILNWLSLFFMEAISQVFLTC